MKIFIIILCFLFYINNLAQAKCAFNCSDVNSKKVLKIFINAKKKLLIIKNGDHSLFDKKLQKKILKELELII